MIRRICSILYDIADLCTRTDIHTSEKLRILAAFVALKFLPGTTVPFLGYSVSGESRVNMIGILKEVFLKGDYVFSTNDPSPVIIDAGGNIGITTLFFKHQHPGSRVWTFEAAKRNYDILTRNVEANGLKDVHTVFGALGMATGTRTMYFNRKNPGGSTMHTEVVASKKEVLFEREEVPALRLSDYITERTALLKLDVEGAEGEILEDLDRTETLAKIDEIVMEYHANEANTSNALRTVLERLERNGFKVVIYDNEHGAYGKRGRSQARYHFMMRAFRS